MHLKRNKITRMVPITRKGTKYVARALSHVDEGIPVVIAVRDMLGLARDLREVKIMIKDKSIKINGKPVNDYRESIKLFNILEAGKRYVLNVKPTGRFALEETKEDFRMAKVVGKKNIAGNKIQINLHDGTNILSKDKISVGDSVKLTLDNNLKDKISVEKGKNVIIFSGKSKGMEGKVKEVDGRKITVVSEGKEVQIDQKNLIVR